MRERPTFSTNTKTEEEEEDVEDDEHHIVIRILVERHECDTNDLERSREHTSYMPSHEICNFTKGDHTKHNACELSIRDTSGNTIITEKFIIVRSIGFAFITCPTRVGCVREEATAVNILWTLCFMSLRETGGHRRVPDGLNLTGGDDNVRFHEHTNARKAEGTKPCQASLGAACLETIG